MDVTPRQLTDLGPTGAQAAPGAGADPGSDVAVVAHRGRSDVTATAKRSPRWRGIILIALVVAALGVVVARGLGNATMFFYNADEAVARRAQLGEDRFRLQGNVLDGSVARADGAANFTVSYGGVDVAVAHQGEIPHLFEPGIPVVLEGHWRGDVFVSDRMLVKHSEVYVEQNPNRVRGYTDDPATSPEPTVGSAA